ncbi:MAG TPA: family 78 glycoside hydrolase catalytic domain, partial [Bacteroidales bacterium]|nr:family 78 glycoside hydrolase catalytic domain [Bacteroidales bacterium]
MKKSAILFLIFSLFTVSAFTRTGVSHLLTENRINPIGLDTPTPRFTWQLVAGERGVYQTVYEIRLAESTAALSKSKNRVWDSGKITSGKSVQVPYKGPKLQSDTRYYWQVRVWDQDSKASAWSEPAWFQTAFFNLSDWKAKWITPASRKDTSASPLLRKIFNLHEDIKSANLYITSHGMYEAFINGSRVGDALLTPGWTSYNERLQYQVYDITDMLQNGSNAVGVVLGNGWYKSDMGYNLVRYKDDISLLCQLEIHYKDGTSELVTSGPGWKSVTGPIRYSDVYDGETYDARYEIPGWSTPGFDDSDWGMVKVKDYKMDNLIATYNEPVRKHEVFTANKLITTPKGDKVIDFGQNLVGWVQVKVKGKAGDTVRIYHAEVLDKKGNFYTDNLRTARQLDTYVLEDNGTETFEPHFSWQGFRYIKIEGYPGEIDPVNFTATAIYSDMTPTGTFECSDSLLNQLQHNIQWGQRGNFLDVPTDCPQRDERLGWTGDAQAFARTATFNFRVDNFFAKWLKDLAVDQKNGDVPAIVPNIGKGVSGSPGWGDVATIAPWTMYLAYGDRRILEDQYESMKGWVDHITGLSKNNLWIPSWSFGDWLFYSLNNDRSGESAITDKSLIAQCFYACSTQNLINAAKVLGKTTDVENYTELLKDIKNAFFREYVTRSGRLVSGTQTAYVLALQFDMLPEDLRDQAADRLVDNIRHYNNHLTTGFLGTPYLCHVLTRFGHDDVAYELLLQKTYPSWLYPVTMGATTIWERWDGIKPDSTFQTPS